MALSVDDKLLSIFPATRNPQSMQRGATALQTRHGTMSAPCGAVKDLRPTQQFASC